MKRAAVTCTCSSCGVQARAAAGGTPLGWLWRGSKLVCGDCRGIGLALPAARIATAATESLAA